MALTKAHSRMIEGAAVNVVDFGAVGDGVTDDTAAIQAAFDFAASLSSDTSRANAIPLASSNFPTTVVFFPAGTYRAGSQIVVGNSRVTVRGENSLIYANNGDIASGYPIKFTGGYKLIIENMSFGCAENGAVEIDAPNISSSTVIFDNCSFTGNKNDAGTAIAGTGVKYSNTSSSLLFNKCVWHNCKHPFELVSGDFIDFKDCWFDISSALITYSDDTGYFNVINNKVTLDNCLFASGPGDKGTRAAFFNCDASATSLNLKIKDTRVTFENGGGPLINWKVPIQLTNGTYNRPGFVIENCMVAPRGQNETFYNRTATPLVRLYTMPNYAVFKDLMWQNTIQGVMAAAPSTDLDTLYASVAAQNDLYSQVNYKFIGSAGNEMYLVATTDDLEYKKWLALFNCFGYKFETVVKGSQSPHYVHTYFSDTDFDNVFLVNFWMTFQAESSSLSRSAVVGVQIDDLNVVSLTIDVLTSTGPTGGEDLTITPKFYNPSTSTYATSISVADKPNNILVFELVKTGIRAIGVRDFYVTPMEAINDWSKTAGMPRQFFQLQA